MRPTRWDEVEEEMKEEMEKEEEGGKSGQSMIHVGAV